MFHNLFYLLNPKHQATHKENNIAKIPAPIKLKKTFINSVKPIVGFIIKINPLKKPIHNIIPNIIFNIFITYLSC